MLYKNFKKPRINIKALNEYLEEMLDVRPKIERWLQERSIGYYKLIQINTSSKSIMTDFC